MFNFLKSFCTIINTVGLKHSKCPIKCENMYPHNINNINANVDNTYEKVTKFGLNKY